MADDLEHLGISPMKRRPTPRLRPAPDRLEEKYLPSSLPGLTSAPAVHVDASHHAHAALVRLEHARPAHAHHKNPHVGVGHGGGGGEGVGNGVGLGFGSGVGIGGSNGNGSGVGIGGNHGNGNGVGAGVGNGSSDGSGMGVGVGGGVGAGVGNSALTLGPDSGTLVPPFGLVLADSTSPVGGVVYNVALITVRNGTSQTFSAQSGLSVEVSGSSEPEPILTGTELWKPGQVIVFYSLNEDTFPPGFTFNLQGASTEVPASIYYGIQYTPNTLPTVLTSIVSTVLVGGRYELLSTAAVS
jgi:hypothetical protein